MSKPIPAFPLMGTAPEDGAPVKFNGMTLRDFFAAQAVIELANASSWRDAAGVNHPWQPESVARRAYQIADAMLRERER